MNRSKGRVFSEGEIVMSDTNTSLISDLAGLSKPMTKLIETVSSGMNIVTTPWQTKRNAQADAEAIRVLNESMREVDGDITYTNANFSITVKKGSIEDTAIARVVQEEVERQVNLSRVVEKAALLLKEKTDVSPEPVEKDWLTRFKNIAQDISDEEMQFLWARILDQEIEKPHSFSYRTLDFLKNVQGNEAKIIENVMKFSLQGSSEVLIFGDKEYLKTENVCFVDALLLEELGLAYGDLALTMKPNLEDYYRISHSNNFIRITNLSDNEQMIPVMKLTSLGKEVFHLISSYYSKSSIENLVKFLDLGEKVKFELIEDVKILDNGQIQWKDDKISILVP